MQIENNKLIAVFMGFEDTANQSGPINYMRRPGKPTAYLRTWEEYEYHELKYHSSWDWLMPVVQQIGEAGEAWINIMHDSIEVNWHPQLENAPKRDYKDWFKVTKIEAVYNAVIEFIKWYNNKQ